VGGAKTGRVGPLRTAGRGSLSALAVALFASGCTASAATSGPTNVVTPTQPASRTATATVAPPVPAALYPLTNLPGPPNAATKPVIAVMVHSGPTAVGLGRADVIYEEFDGTASFRVIALYQSNAAPVVGPVIDTRPVDGYLLGVLDPVVVSTGGPKGFIAQLDANKVVDASALAHPTLYHQPGPFVTTASFVPFAHPGTVPPIFTFASSGSGPGVKGVKVTGSVVIAVPGYPAQTWTYDARTGLWREPAMPWIPPVTNLVVQKVAYHTVLLHHPTGQAVQTAKVFGTGAASVLSSGVLITCQWRKAGAGAVTNYFDRNGIVVQFRAGRTAVLLAPAGTTVKVVG
jgi:Protein of unknown function (DUF3048) N-terminal domain/Protein of unknown function (DUF3048) C-terminal domain